MFSVVKLPGHPEIKLMGLAPMAVAPEYHRKGFGSGLVETALEQCQQLSYTALVVFGHLRYYPRFSFSPASGFGIKCKYIVSDEEFVAVEIEPRALSGKRGTVRYHHSFNNVLQILRSF